MSTDAIVILREEHQELRRLFREFEHADEDAERGRLVDEILERLTVHTYLENECMYPRVLELMPDLRDDILESFEEHHVADVLCMELSTMSPDDERYTPKTTVLIENVRHHMEEEEEEWFPQVRDSLGHKALQDIGQELLDLRQDAPRRPRQPSALKKAIDSLIG